MDDLDPRIYTVAWIAPLEIEAQAALHMLDNRHPGRFRMERGDDYVFQAGDACGHNIIIATLPAGELYGTGSAAALAHQVKKFFPNLWFGLLVGVAAGLPNLLRCPPRDIRLGDVLVGLPIGDNAGLIPYDLGKETGSNGFQLLRAGHGLARTETVVRSAIGSIKLMAPNDADEVLQHYKRIEHKEHCLGTYADPGQEQDRLYQVDELGIERLVQRKQRPASKRTRIWYGSIGSGEKLMKNAQRRNELRDKHDIIGLEMEAAGTMDRIPVGVIRGVCDYGDEHKNKEWQPYAAAMAAAYARTILGKIGPIVTSQGLSLSLSRKRNFDEGNCVPLSEVGRHKRPYYGVMFAQDSSSETLSSENCNQETPMSSHGDSTPECRTSGDSGIIHCKQQPVTKAVELDATLKQSLIDQLYFDQIDERLINLTAAQGRTCRWFLDKDEYISWNDSSRQPVHGGFLWVKGNPGTGKSTLMKFLFEKAKANARTNSSHIILSFFFLARGTTEEKSTTGLYRSILHQLFERAPETQTSFEWMTTNGAKAIQRNGWSEQALKQTLGHAVQALGSRSLMIFVDALDECNQDQVADMVCFCEELCDSAQDWKVLLQVCFSSRHYPTVVIEKGIEVTLEDEIGHTQDIQQYIKSSLRLGKSAQADKLRSEILEKSSGIFLWVVLVLEILNREYRQRPDSIRKMGDRLKEIPPRLHDLFEMILTRDGENLDQLHICLKWILFAVRPLKPQELYFAVQFGQDKGSAGFWDKEDIEVDNMESFVSNFSKGLAGVTRNRAAEVQFIHESVRDFLRAKYESQPSEAPGGFVGQSHILLRDCCLAQLESLDPETIGIEDPLPQVSAMTEARENVNAQYPFLDYAILNVLRHADCAQQNDIDQRDFLATFSRQKWILLNNFLEKHQIRRYTKSVSLLYILAEKNVAHLIRIHPREVSCFDVEFENERYGTPIFAALATGSREAVWALLRKEAEMMPSDSPLHNLYEGYCQDRNRPTRLGRNFVFSRRKGVLSYLAEEDETLLASYLLTSALDPNRTVTGVTDLLRSASQNGHAVIVKYLLEQYSLNSNMKDFMSAPLYEAARKGHEAVVKVLLEHDAIDPNLGNGYDETPLYTAVNNGHEAIVKLLLKQDTIDPNKGLPLFVAACNGQEAIVKLLLEHDAIDPNLGNGYDETPLYTAVRNWHEAIVKLLLEKDAIDPNKGRGNSSPLYEAARYGHEAIVKLLLKQDAIDPNLGNGYGETPLYTAVKNGHEAIVKLLLKQDTIDLNLGNGYGETLLYAAAENEYEAVVKLLLSSEDTCNSVTDELLKAVLVTAADKGHRGIYELLLSTEGVWKNAARNVAGHALIRAAIGGHEAIVNALLAEGFTEGFTDLNHNDAFGRSALWHAAAKGHDAIVKLLLMEGGSDLNHQDKWGTTALAHAAMLGHTTTVQLLVAQGGIEIDRDDIYGQTPLSRAAEFGRDAVVRLLLGKDSINLNHQDCNSQTPLSLSAKMGHTAVVKLLCEKSGIWLNHQDVSGQTPLSRASQNRHVEVVRLLLERHGIDIHLPDHQGQTPLSLAQAKRHANIVELLESYALRLSDQ